ncbi:ECF transporter S component [Ectobacillus antri]|uniref:ECF transporter S component n=1 Tax=Ectobacillus antri TaxID=2486280 RepID=A0ABT6H646_9BACI|nr:ECF transporter S component [Ectobacillus antri]MDG4656990.1 ECF transporter S component [Ectobacillus antri]MDG5754092.1 ECF transporter S component [Ectobacillus antri]
MSKHNAAIIGVCLTMVGALAYLSFVNARHFLWVSILILTVTMLPFYIRFEKKAFASREIVFIAVLAAIAAVSRVPFSVLPSIQPTSFVIIVSALVLGGEAGFLIGATAALVSNLFLGQGPWTLWQMCGWGLMGLIAGMLRNYTFMQKHIGRIMFGIIAGFVFGWFTNISVFITFLGELTWQTLLLTYVTSFYFDLAHAASNAFFLAVFGRQWIKILTRFKGKYGLLE